MKKPLLLLAALCAAAPLALLLPGCSGGSSNNPFANPTTPTVPNPATSQTTNLVLGNGQRAILTTIKNGGNLTGTLQIVPTPVALTKTATKTAAAIPLQFTFGTYVITGTVTPGGAFTISGDFGTLGGPFSMTGQLQTATSDGNYTLKVGGDTETGILPKSGTPFPTTTTPPPSNGSFKLTGSLIYSAVTPGEVISTPVTSFKDLKEGSLTTATFSAPLAGTRQNLALNAGTEVLSGNGTTRLFQLTLASSTLEAITAGLSKGFTVGQNISFNIQNGSILQYSQSSISGTAIGIKVWRSTGGTAVVKAIGPNSATIELQNVQIDPSPIFGGVGSFRLNGTLVATGLTAKTG